MGGRGASSGRAGGGSIPRINNPAGIPSNAMTEDEFLMLKGYGDAVSGVGVDMIGGANQLYLSTKQRQALQAKMNDDRTAYFEKRQQAREEYKKLIASGKIRNKTTIEKTITIAHGNPDLASTQSARRMAEKRGYDWKTGKKLK